MTDTPPLADVLGHLYTADDVADYLGGDCTPDWVVDQARQGRIRSIKRGHNAARQFLADHVRDALAAWERQATNPAGRGRPRDPAGLTSGARRALNRRKAS